MGEAMCADQETNHGTPIKPEDVDPVEYSTFREKVTQEERFHG